MVYRPNVWFYDDLHNCILQHDFGMFDGHIDDGECLNPDRHDFPVLLSFVLVRMAHRMLAELSDLSVYLRQELTLVDARLTGPNADLYQEAYPA